MNQESYPSRPRRGAPRVYVRALLPLVLSLVAPYGCSEAGNPRSAGGEEARAPADVLPSSSDSPFDDLPPGPGAEDDPLADLLEGDETQWPSDPPMEDGDYFTEYDPGLDDCFDYELYPNGIEDPSCYHGTGAGIGIGTGTGQPRIFVPGKPLTEGQYADYLLKGNEDDDAQRPTNFDMELYIRKMTDTARNNILKKRPPLAADTSPDSRFSAVRQARWLNVVRGVNGELALKAMNENKRIVPVLVIGGEAAGVVFTYNADTGVKKNTWIMTTPRPEWSWYGMGAKGAGQRRTNKIVLTGLARQPADYYPTGYKGTWVPAQSVGMAVINGLDELYGAGTSILYGTVAAVTEAPAAKPARYKVTVRWGDGAGGRPPTTSNIYAEVVIAANGLGTPRTPGVLPAQRQSLGTWATPWGPPPKFMTGEKFLDYTGYGGKPLKDLLQPFVGKKIVVGGAGPVAGWVVETLKLGLDPATDTTMEKTKIVWAGRQTDFDGMDFNVKRSPASERLKPVFKASQAGPANAAIAADDTTYPPKTVWRKPVDTITGIDETAAKPLLTVKFAPGTAAAETADYYINCFGQDSEIPDLVSTVRSSYPLFVRVDWPRSEWASWVTPPPDRIPMAIKMKEETISGVDDPKTHQILVVGSAMTKPLNRAGVSPAQNLVESSPFASGGDYAKYYAQVPDDDAKIPPSFAVTMPLCASAGKYLLVPACLGGVGFVIQGVPNALARP